MNFPVFSQLAGKLVFRDGFARDCLLQQQVRCEPDFSSVSAREIGQPMLLSNLA